METREEELATRARGGLLCGWYNDGGGEAIIPGIILVLTIFLLPSSHHATSVETPGEGTPTSTGNPWPTSVELAGRCPSAPGRVVKVGAWWPAGNARVGLK